jgi:hypothetical protein
MVDTTEILRSNLKDILGMLVDDVWHQNSAQHAGLPPRHRPLESATLTESNQSLRNSAGHNTSKLTPHSISKMNITELKQSLSQNLNRDFIEPNAQKSAKPTTPWNASRTI